MARWASLAALVIGGLIVADIWRNPAGTKAAASGFSTATSPVVSALAGK